MQSATRFPPPRPIQTYVQQHAEEAADLRYLRPVLVRAPHVRLPDLLRVDERLAGHLQGLAAAGPTGAAYCTQALERATAGTVFAATVNAIENHDDRALNRMYALARAVPDAWRGVVSALGWVSAQSLHDIVPCVPPANLHESNRCP